MVARGQLEAEQLLLVVLPLLRKDKRARRLKAGLQQGVGQMVGMRARTLMQQQQLLLLLLLRMRVVGLGSCPMAQQLWKLLLKLLLTCLGL
jgi:hypothetical protein